MKFSELAIGCRFCFGEVSYVKMALSLAQDEHRIGHLFLGVTEVLVVGEPMLVAPEEAARCACE